MLCIVDTQIIAKAWSCKRQIHRRINSLLSELLALSWLIEKHRAGVFSLAICICLICPCFPLCVWPSMSMIHNLTSLALGITQTAHIYRHFTVLSLIGPWSKSNIERCHCHLNKLQQDNTIWEAQCEQVQKLLPMLSWKQWGEKILSLKPWMLSIVFLVQIILLKWL